MERQQGLEAVATRQCRDPDCGAPADTNLRAEDIAEEIGAPTRHEVDVGEGRPADDEVDRADDGRDRVERARASRMPASALRPARRAAA